MFGRKKDAAKISDRTPVFHVRYIGCTETYVATGRGCSYVPVQRLWDNSLAERNMRKVAIHISPMGLSLRDVSEKQTTTTSQQPHQQQHNQQQQHSQDHQQQRRQRSQDFAIENISFCNVDRAVNERIFSWIYGQSHSQRLHCHAVLCSTARKAQTMAIVLSRAFQIAYKDWRARHRDSFPPVTRSPTWATSGIISSNATDVKNPFVASPASSASLVEGKEGGEPSMAASAGEERRWAVTGHHSTAPPSGKHAHFSDDVTASDASPKHVTSSVSVQQSATPSHFVCSSIWDREVEDVVSGMDSLHADLDLEEENSD